MWQTFRPRDCKDFAIPGMAKTLPSQRFWDTMEILRINKGENIAENDTKSLAPPPTVSATTLPKRRRME